VLLSSKFTLGKALHEPSYELYNRPDWVTSAACRHSHTHSVRLVVFLESEKTVMAKRPTSQSKGADPAEPAQPKPKRVRKAAPAKQATNRSPSPEAIGTATREPTVDDIRRRAYERYLERGGRHGRHFDDWLEAERELKTKK
jgi:hypothetical protein